METEMELGRAWNPKTPRYSIAQMLDKLHVSTSIKDAVRPVKRACEKARKANLEFTPEIVQECLEYAALRHEANRKLYRAVMSGNFAEELTAADYEE